MDVARDEVFGRVLSVIPVDTLDEAIAVVNASRFGNGASIFTGSGAAVRRFRREVEAGMVGVNIRRGRAGRLVPVLGVEGLLPRGPARAAPTGSSSTRARRPSRAASCRPGRAAAATSSSAEALVAAALRRLTGRVSRPAARVAVA